MNERLAQLMQDKKLTALRIAEILEVQPSNISHILSGRNNPNYDFMLKLVERFPDVSPDWLFLGQGDMYRTLNFSSSVDVPLMEDNIVIEDKFNVEAIDIKDSTEQKNEQPTDVIAQLPTKSDSEISKIIIFYKDGTFESFSERF